MVRASSSCGRLVPVSYTHLKSKAMGPQPAAQFTVTGSREDVYKRQDQSTAPYFMEIGMHCLGCPASRGESLEEACAVHGVDCDELIAKLNEHLGAKKA